VYFEKYPKWSFYGVAPRMALMGRLFEEVYKKPLSMVKDPIVEWRFRS
jgi:hypothetical protein